MKALAAQFAALVGAFAAFVLTAVLPGYVMVHFVDRLPRADPRLMIIAVQFIVLAVLFVVARLPLRTLAPAAVPRSGVKAGAWLVLGTFTLSLLITVTIVLTGVGPQPNFEDTLIKRTREFPQTGLLGYIALLVILAPLFEELLFRVLILGHCLRRLPPWVALPISAALFIPGHSSWIFSGLGGLAYGLLYLRFRSLWLCWAAHSAHNLISSGGATLLVLYLHDRQFLMPRGDNIFVLQLLWFAVALACFALFLRYVFGGVEGGPWRLLMPRRKISAEAITA